MGTVGIHRVRPIHIQTLTDQYRRMLGEIRFYQRQSDVPSSKLAKLTNDSRLLSQSLAMIDPEFDAATIKPISFRLPVELPGTALTRAVLAELRAIATCVSVAALVNQIAHRHNIPQSRALSKRVTQCVAALTKQGVVQTDERGCILTHLLNLKPHHC